MFGSIHDAARATGPPEGGPHTLLTVAACHLAMILAVDVAVGIEVQIPEVICTADVGAIVVRGEGDFAAVDLTVAVDVTKERLEAANRRHVGRCVERELPAVDADRV